MPANFKGTPQQLLDAMVARLSAESETEVAVFVTGSVEPSSNVGPWLKDGVSWYVWDDVTGSYIPQTIPTSSLGYSIGSDTPDNTIYRFWIQTTVGGSPLALKIYYSGSWVDVYATTLSAYMTTSAFNAAIASYSTTAQMNTAISAAIAGIPGVSFYPAQGVSSVGQTIAIDGAAHKIALGSAPINPSPSPFDIALSRYVAPSTGYYQVSVSTQFDNSTGTASGMEIEVGLYKNGSFIGNGMGDVDSTPSPNGSRWSPGFAGLVQLNAGQYIEIFAIANDGVNAGNVTATVCQMSVTKSG